MQLNSGLISSFTSSSSPLKLPSPPSGPLALPLFTLLLLLLLLLAEEEEEERVMMMMAQEADEEGQVDSPTVTPH